MTASPKYSIVIPCYRSGPWIAALVDAICEAMRTRGSFEIVLVNDGSPDDTWTVIEAAAERRAEVVGVDLLNNVGQYCATLCGLEAARGEILVTMDDDFQHPPGEIPKLLEELERHPQWDCVIATFPSKRHGPLRRLGTRARGAVLRVFFGKPPGVQATGFRALRRPLVDAVLQCRTMTPVINPLIFQTTDRIGTVPVEHQPRRRGASGYSLLRLAQLFLDNVFSASTLPLRCISLLGLTAAGASVLLGIFYLVRRLLNQITVPGFATQVLLIIFFGGLTLFSIGLLGEYVVRILEEVRPRPRYVIRQRAGEAAHVAPNCPTGPTSPSGDSRPPVERSSAARDAPETRSHDAGPRPQSGR